MSDVTAVKGVTYTYNGKSYDVVSVKVVYTRHAGPNVVITIPPTPRGSEVSMVTVEEYIKECGFLQSGVYNKNETATISIDMTPGGFTLTDWPITHVDMGSLSAGGELKMVSITLTHPIYQAHNGYVSALGLYTFDGELSDGPGDSENLSDTIVAAFKDAIECVAPVDGAGDDDIASELLEIDKQGFSLLEEAIAKIKENTTVELEFPFPEEDGDLDEYLHYAFMNRAASSHVEADRSPLNLWMKLLLEFLAEANYDPKSKKLIVSAINRYKKPSATISMVGKSHYISSAIAANHIKGYVITNMEGGLDWSHVIAAKDTEDKKKSATGALAGYVNDKAEGQVKFVDIPHWMAGFCEHGDQDIEHTSVGKAKDNQPKDEEAQEELAEAIVPYMVAYAHDRFWAVYNMESTVTIYTLFNEYPDIKTGDNINIKDKSVLFSGNVRTIEHHLSLSTGQSAAYTLYTLTHVLTPQSKVIKIGTANKLKMWSNK